MDRVKQKRWQGLLVAAGLAAVTLAAYWPVLQNGFVVYDDHEYVTENPQVAGGLSWANVGWAFRTRHASNWHPLTWLSHELDCQLYGLKPAGHHLTSLLLHIANTLLLFLVLKCGMRSAECGVEGMQNAECRMQNGEGERGKEEGRGQNARRSLSSFFFLPSSFLRCAFVAGLFALHPLHVESVAWVAERKDVLSGLFFLLTLWAYVRYAQVQSPKSKVPSQEATSRDTQHAIRNQRSASPFPLPSFIFYLLSLFFFALGLMSKPMLVTVPFVLLLLDYWPLGRMKKYELGSKKAESGATLQTSSPCIMHHSYFILLEKLPFLALSGVSCVVTVLAQQGAMQPLANVSFAARVSNALVAYARYLGKTFWPVDLATPYPYPSHWPAGSVLLAAALLAGVSVAAVGYRRRYPFVVTGWFWFVGMLVPVIGLVQVGEQSMADRYTYLPLIGIFILVAWGLGGKWISAETQKAQRDPEEGNNAEAQRVQAAAEGARTFLSASPLPSTRRTGLSALRRCGLSVLGVVVLLACAGRTRDQLQWWRNSESLFKHAVAVSAKNFFAYYSLGLALDNQGRLDEALTNYLKAVDLQPNYPEPLNNIGCILAGRKQLAPAVPYFERALRSNPQWADAHNNLAHCLCELGRFAEAIPHFEAVLKANPTDRVAQESLRQAIKRSQ